MKSINTAALLLLVLGLAQGTTAAPMDATAAAHAVTGWLRLDASPLGARLGADVQKVETFQDPDGAPLYHVVYLKPSGFVIVAAEDQAEPIIAFVAKGRFDPSTNNPLGALVARDLPHRVAHARRHANVAAGVKNLGKWQQLGQLALGATNSPASGTTNGSISDIRIAPLLSTTWGQGTASNGVACYNFFTPPYAAGNPANSVCGCVATAMAQLLYYYQFPATGVGTASFLDAFRIANNYPNNSVLLALRGGDGNGGPYEWDNMPANPMAPTLTQCEAIGSLTYDAGVAVSMQYTLGLSTASLDNARVALMNTFQYSSAILTETNSINTGYDLTDMVNPDLDAHMPVIFGINNDTAAHCIVCDGYGYNYGAIYHHLNMGWGGDDDAWYQLPLIGLTDTDSFYNFNACLFNIYTNGSGEIISGRVLDASGNPLPATGVTAVTAPGGLQFRTTTDLNGIYALAGLPSATACVVTVTNAGYSPVITKVTTGTSVLNATNCGNIWGVNFALSLQPVPPVFTNQSPSLTVVTGSNATFYAETFGQPPIGYQWQYQPSGSLNWVNVNDDGTNSGAQTATLTISPATLAINGKPFQCVATNSFGSATSAPVVLTVAAIPWISLITLAGEAGISGGADGLNTNALFYSPHGLAVDSYTNVFVADLYNHDIRRLTPSAAGWAVSTIAGQAGHYGSANGTGTNAQFHAPYGVVVDASGNLFVVDTGNDLIRRLTPSGTNWIVTTIAGTAGTQGATDGTSALFKLPMGIAVDAADNLYIADEGNYAIRKLTLAGGSWSASTLAGSSNGSSDGTNTAAQFGQPYGITINAAGTVFVTDKLYHTIRQVKPVGGNWVVTTIAGKSGKAGYADGLGTAALFNNPVGIVADANGNLFVADYGNNVVRQMTLIGTNWQVFTVAGLAGVSGSVDGVGGKVRLNGPSGLAVNHGTNLYVSDGNNNTIRGPDVSVVPASVPAPAIGQFVKAAAANSFALAWQAVLGQSYQVQYCTNLSQPAWSNLTSVTASNWTGAVSVSGSTPAGFYRVVMVP